MAVDRINRFSCRILWHLLALSPRGAKVLSAITVQHLDNDDIIYLDNNDDILYLNNIS